MQIIYILLSTIVTHQTQAPIYGIFVTVIAWYLFGQIPQAHVLPGALGMGGALLAATLKKTNQSFAKEIVGSFVLFYWLLSLFCNGNYIYEALICIIMGWGYFGFSWYMF